MKQFKNILLVTDLKLGSQPALKRAISLAKHNKANLMVVDTVEDANPHVVFTQPLKSMDSKTKHKNLQNLLIEGKRQLLKDLIQSVKSEGVKVKGKILQGTPFVEIIQEVILNGFDLVMKTADGNSGARRRLLGTEDIRLMRKCPCPVWIIKPTRKSKYHRILAAVNTDPHLKVDTLNPQIMELATSLAERENSELHILHVWRLDNENAFRQDTIMTKKEVDHLVKEKKDAHKEKLDELLEKFPLQGIKAQVHLIKGNPRKEIPALAEKMKAELVIMGTVVRTGIPGLLVGNTAETVLSDLDTCLLTVKPEGFQTPILL